MNTSKRNPNICELKYISKKREKIKIIAQLSETKLPKCFEIINLKVENVLKGKRKSYKKAVLHFNGIVYRILTFCFILKGRENILKLFPFFFV